MPNLKSESETTATEKEIAGQRIVLVGESNPYGDNPEFALYPHPERSAGWRLCCEIFGMERAEYLRLFDRVNLCRVIWSTQFARQTIFEHRLLEKRCILLGAKVAEAFGVQFAHCRRHAQGGTRLTARPADLLCLYHPSGRCRGWNEPRTIREARRAVAEFAPELLDVIGKR